MSSGWVKVHRKLQNNPIWTSEPFTRGQAWVDLILLANHEQGYIYVRDHKINIKRGQVGWSQNRLSNRWQWSRTKVRKFLNDLEKEQQIKQQKSKSYTIITLINYDKYQPQKQQKNNSKTTEKQQKNTNKNVKNEKNEKKNPSNVASGEPPNDAVDRQLWKQAKEVAHHLRDRIIECDPGHKYANNPPSYKRWYVELERALRMDGRTRKQLVFIIDYIFTKNTRIANFWKPNVQSGPKLREKFDQLKHQIKNEVDDEQQNRHKAQRKATEAVEKIDWED